jgi:four helix bundle protein
MSDIKNFRDLKVWQKAHQFVLNIYKITEGFPEKEKFGLISQIRRAAVSIAANIVEGFKRRGIKDTCNFYTISEASLEEVRYYLILSKDLKYTSVEISEKLESQAEEISKMLYATKKSVC